MKWLCCLPILHSKCNCWRPCHTWPSSKNKHASIHCPARLHLLSPFPLPRSPACSTRVPPASRRHWSHLAWSSTMLCPARLHGRRVGANLPGCSYLWRRPSFSWSPAAAPLWFVQRTTPAGAAQLRLMPHCGRRHLIPPPHLPGRGLEVLLKDELIQQGEDLLWFFAKFSFWSTIRWIAMSCFCCCYMMNCYELLLLLLYDELLWAAAGIWWIAHCCCCCMMSCYELLLLYDAFRWCCYMIITSHLDHRISINNCSSFKCGSCVLRLN